MFKGIVHTIYENSVHLLVTPQLTKEIVIFRITIYNHRGDPCRLSSAWNESPACLEDAVQLSQNENQACNAK